MTTIENSKNIVKKLYTNIGEYINENGLELPDLKKVLVIFMLYEESNVAKTKYQEALQICKKGARGQGTGQKTVLKLLGISDTKHSELSRYLRDFKVPSTSEGQNGKIIVTDSVISLEKCAEYRKDDPVFNEIYEMAKAKLDEIIGSYMPSKPKANPQKSIVQTKYNSEDAFLVITYLGEWRTKAIQIIEKDRSVPMYVLYVKEELKGLEDAISFLINSLDNTNDNFKDIIHYWTIYATKREYSNLTATEYYKEIDGAFTYLICNIPKLI